MNDGADGYRTETATPLEADGSVAITAELVREVTEKVYALMVQDLKLTRERSGHSMGEYKEWGGRRC